MSGGCTKNYTLYSAAKIIVIASYKEILCAISQIVMLEKLHFRNSRSVLLNLFRLLVRAFEPHCGLQVSKKQNVSSPLTRKDSILWGASVTKR